MTGAQQPPGWYPAEGDPPGTVRWWDGTKWVGGPQSQGVQQQAGYVAPGAGALASGRELADPWMRIAAAVIDGILMGIVGAIFGVAAAVSSGFSGDSGEFDFVPDGRAIILGLIGSIIIAGYHTAMNTYLSGGLGKQLLGLRIVGRNGEEPLGTPLGPKRSLNHIVDILSAVPIVNIPLVIGQGILNLVSLVFLFSDPEHRTVMDRFADTYVVKKQ